MSVRVFLGALATVGLLALSACIPNPSTKLEIDITGGFAFVPSKDKKMLQVAYLNSVDEPGCHVEQIGTQLVIVRADILPSNPPAREDRVYDLAGWDVSFPALDTTNDKVKGLRNNRMPSPHFPGPTGKWTKSEYVPGMQSHHKGSSVRADWDKFISGKMILKGGHITGSTPSDPLMKDAKFTFRIAGSADEQAAVTDKMVYTVYVPGEQVEMVLTKRPVEGQSGRPETKRLILKAPETGKPVRLTLRGLHSMPMTGAYGSIEMRDFCAFYSLVQGKDGLPIPPGKRLKIFYEGPRPANANGMTPEEHAAQPSPGFYCNGDWP
jgi:hypothetical protein